MAANIIDGAALAASIKQDVADRVRDLASKGRRVHLTAILVGSTPAGELYADPQRQACQAVGIDYELKTLPADSHARAVAGMIQGLNRDPSVSGVMLQLPLPDHLD